MRDKLVKEIKTKVYAANIRAKARGYVSKITVDGVLRVYDQQNGKCLYCGQSVGTSFSLDHIEPLSKADKNVNTNIAIACHRCNYMKRDLSVEEMLAHMKLIVEHNQD